MAFAAAISDPFRLEFPLYSMGSDRALSRAAIAGKPPKQGAPAEKTDPGKHTGAEVSRFYICLDNLHNVGRCVESQNDGTVITIPGVPARGGVVAMFTGVVQVVEHDPKRGPNREWLVTMRDRNPA
jgi:hypothetical protein